MNQAFLFENDLLHDARPNITGDLPELTEPVVIGLGSKDLILLPPNWNASAFLVDHIARAWGIDSPTDTDLERIQSVLDEVL